MNTGCTQELNKIDTKKGTLTAGAFFGLVLVSLSIYHLEGEKSELAQMCAKLNIIISCFGADGRKGCAFYEIT